MDIIIHNHYQYDDSKLLEKLSLILKQLNKMNTELEALTAEVEESKGIMLSAKTLIEGIAQKLEEAGTDKVKLTELKESLNAGSEELAAAILANPLPGETPTPE